MNLKELAPQTTKRLNKVMESRFGFAIDYDKLTYAKAQRLNIALSENLNAIRKSYGAHTAEKNPKYMEMLMVREGLNAWLDQHTPIMEGELETAEAVLAAKDMVDSIQDVITDASKMMNEELPPLLDTIRDQLGTAQADQFKQTATAALQGLMDALNGARDSLDQGSRALAGEEAAPMDMGGVAPAPAGDMGAELPEPEVSDLDDGFAGADAAAGGPEDLARASLMRARDFIREDDETGNIHSNIVTVSSLIKTKIDQGELQAKLPASMVIRMIQNTGIVNFGLADLKAANDEIPAMKNIIKQIAGDEVLFKTDSYSTVSNADDDFGSVDNPQQTVSNMAKAALKRRQD